MNGQEIVSDGKTVWTFQPETNEVYIDNFENVVGENINPSNIHNLYRKGYKYVYREEKWLMENRIMSLTWCRKKHRKTIISKFSW